MLQPQMSHVGNKASRHNFIAIFMPLLIVVLSARQGYILSIMSLKLHKNQINTDTNQSITQVGIFLRKACEFKIVKCEFYCFFYDATFMDTLNLECSWY